MDIKNTPIRNIKCFNSPDYTSLFCVAANYNILLVNYQALNVITTYDLINQFMQDNGYTNLVIFDVPKNSDVLALKEWPNLKGLFYESSDDSLFQQGLEAIEQGKLWFPRDVTDSWMRQMLASEQQTALQSSNLTCKEIKVLNLLFSGLHSTAIADSLFISEATVRVHLHKIYQKISVKNKQQALLWCQKNLSKVNN
ncbi:LuxR C-terminal-related transcriptional regulator [Pseudoalteromonas sp. SCSIO 43095]|jgi:DNA-binding NarL/FixJ family response regulator|uniref:LuxR C-terminal-related transcriptional regulator n=1 Tax=Pseudoalteromonas TaxID=53246 RepID=UPI0004491357|nr:MULTISPECIES: LuxR C-terminal-related transcriptional regulator [Pseudoalteromonas]EWS98154.1 transcriptional regulator [Pseudoalteromonas sp. SCSIO_11900]MBT2150569.1 helix-turn-helix transcriptional regulator [Pseudoalteromonas tetraodonis]MCK8135409.1 LuxR C-terminal-related transcriptional regulator [Pseudoalteromonas sp. 2CM28B]MDX1360453.1 LuxR C-terminal-related transcriptional regulator [Pseudoalteromonas tetraodonis]MDX1728732.1 LuxR C-terminal-related transcriptional regulator [Ps